MSADLAGARRAATRVGLITLPIGVAAVSAPRTVGRLLRLGDHPAAVRLIGAADLALVPGLVSGRRRSGWMTARAGLNLLIAAYCVQVARREGSSGAKVAAVAMVVATVDDRRTIRTLRRTEISG